MPEDLSKFFLCIIIFGLITISPGCSEFSINPRYFYTSCEYSLHINANEPMSNVTFYIPLPVKKGTPVMGDVQLTSDFFKKNNVTVEFVKSPPDLDIPELYRIPDNPPLWVKIQADRLSPDVPQGARPGIYRAYLVEISNSTEQKSPLAFSDTVYPLENQSVFMPKIHFSAPTVTQTIQKRPYEIYYSPVSIPQQIPLYAEYFASPTARVEIFSNIRVDNSWKEKYDESGGNDYEDKFDWMHTGPIDGWQVAEGTFIAAEGSYPNVSDPVWQKMLNETS